MPARPMTRGSNVALTREIPGLTGVVLAVALASPEPVLNDNLVVATLLCDASSRLPSREHVVFFNQLTSPELSVAQLEKARSRGDLEQVEVDLGGVPADVARIVVVAYINEGLGHRRALGQLREARVRVLDLANDTELVSSENLAPALSNETGLVLAELYRHGGDWKFKVVGQGYPDGIAGILRDHGQPL
ncbi:TerD family protein [Cellulomonas fimi]|uniref:Stress protein n=1 Tax=Cellulomonas fimi (strain ATCC 484 / DSM 20113 / JCM 1341 / CCUG 24087 / LMG 16345 / NBRC 15513 / NCIMB 8980 / NCTC 7547 / NRS-133) TaxID=590998 RepID=F4H5N3_CELFA|nr:TerD family protein [Cellulomonas fimi]AEE44357.1 stress protein [Cellulomonas fimi ATCC 484]NNH08118.1 TerD family protein [Cellulomonas fimi]VEH26195.1 General stress protein 16U [Cellulomonas fimi]